MSFLCVDVKLKKDDEPSSVSSSPVQLPNVFTILMAHRSPSRTLPPRIAPARNKKDELHNAILDWLEKQAMERVLDGLSFSCGSELQDADIPPDLNRRMLCTSRNCSALNQLKNCIIQQTSKTSASIARKKCQNLKSHRNIILSVLTVPSPESQELVDLSFFLFLLFIFFCIFIYKILCNFKNSDILFM